MTTETDDEGCDCCDCCERPGCAEMVEEVALGGCLALVVIALLGFFAWMVAVWLGAGF